MQIPLCVQQITSKHFFYNVNRQRVNFMRLQQFSFYFQSIAVFA